MAQGLLKDLLLNLNLKLQNLEGMFKLFSSFPKMLIEGKGILTMTFLHDQ